MANKKRFPKAKTVFVVESNQERQAEIKESMSHQQHWSFEFFADARECIGKIVTIKPLAVFLDIEHFDKTHDEKYGFNLIDEMKAKSPDTEVLVFSNSDNEHWAAESLRHGALDYIMFNPHQYVKMEYELQWLETVKDQQSEDKKFIKRMIYLAIFLVAFILLMVALYQTGLLKEGNETEILIGS